MFPQSFERYFLAKVKLKVLPMLQNYYISTVPVI